MAGNDTMPIIIPIGLDAKQVDEGAAKASSAFERLGQTFKKSKSVVLDTSKSMETLIHEQEKNGAASEKLNKQLEELEAQYNKGNEAADRDAQAQAILAEKMYKLGDQIQKNNEKMEQNSAQQYAYGINELDLKIKDLETSLETEVAQLRISGQEMEAEARAREGAAQMAELHSQRVDLLRSAVQRASQTEAEGSRVTAALSKEFSSAQDKLLGMTRKLDDLTDGMKEYNTEAKNAQQAIGDVVGGILGTEVTFKQAGSALTNNLTNPIVDFGKKALQSAKDAESMEQTFDTVFKDQAANARAWSKQLSDDMDVSEYRLRGMMSSWKGMFEGMEISAKDQGRLIQELSTRVYDMAAMYDTGVEDMFEKINSGLVGSSKPLRDHGIIITENTVKQYAWKNGIAQSGKELTEQEKVLARFELMMKQTSQTVGRWSDEADTLSGRLKTNDERMNDLSTRMGNTLIPVMERVMNIIEPIVKGISELDDGQLRLILTIGGVVAAIGPILNLVGMLQQMRIAQGLGSITGATRTLGGAFAGMGTTLSVSLLPVLLQVAGLLAAIGAIGAGGKWFWDQGSKEQKDIFWSKLQASKDASMGDWFKNMFNGKAYARGTTYAPGGPSLVHKDEIVDLPQGSRVYNARTTKGILGGNSDAVVAKLDEMIGEVRELVSVARSTERATRDQQRLARQR